VPHAQLRTRRHASRLTFGLAVAAALASLAIVSAQTQTPTPPSQRPSTDSQPPPGFRFKSGVELVNVTATVTDAGGRFVANLRQEDFLVYEDDQPQTVTHFSADRVPVSLGILLDTSQSMTGEKFDAARSALDRFLMELSSPDDEFFLIQFSSVPTLLQDWTRDRHLVSRALAGVSPRGGTAMYDAIADSVPLMQRAQNRKKAIVIISDGVDMTSATPLVDVHRIIRQSEALVYAVGIDCSNTPTFRRQPFFQRGGQPIPRPFPMPGGRPPQWPRQYPPVPPPSRDFRCSDPVDVMALRDLTDDSGGRTEIVRVARDLEPATSGIADELSKQYYLGYPANGKKDGRWHTIRVEVRDRTYRVRARRGYVAS
jgi:VWFA-related protein